MTTTTPETDPLHDSLVQFTAAIGAAVDDICSYGLTIGESYVPFNPDPDEDCDTDDVACSQVWVRVMNLSVKPTGTEGWDGNGLTLSLVMDLEVGVLRCVEIVEEGEAPDTTAVMTYALQAMTDMKAILAAAMNCEVWDSIDAGTWAPLGPQGGQYGGFWTFSVEFENDCSPIETGSI